MFGLKRLYKTNNQEPMNKNIEVINLNLYALRFSLIPFIKEITYKPDEEIPAYQEPLRLDKGNGIILLNKDHAGYELLKDAMIKAMKKKNNGELERCLLLLKSRKNKDNGTIIYEAALRCELERRLYSEMNCMRSSKSSSKAVN